MRFLIWSIIFHLLSIPGFSQSVLDEMVFYGNVEIEKPYKFKLEKLILIDNESYYYDSQINNRTIPEYVDPEDFDLIIFNENRSINSLVEKEFNDAIIYVGISDYLEYNLGSIEFLDNQSGIINGNKILYKLISHKNLNNFGNDRYSLNISTSNFKIDIPLIRIENEYKFVFNKYLLESFGLRIFESEDLIPMRTTHNGKTIYEEMSIWSIGYELRKNKNYFSSYSIIPLINGIVRKNLYSENVTETKLPLNQVWYLFSLDELK